MFRLIFMPPPGTCTLNIQEEVYQVEAYPLQAANATNSIVLYDFLSNFCLLSCVHVCAFCRNVTMWPLSVDFVRPEVGMWTRRRAWGANELHDGDPRIWQLCNFETCTENTVTPAAVVARNILWRYLKKNRRQRGSSAPRTEQEQMLTATHLHIRWCVTASRTSCCRLHIQIRVLIPVLCFHLYLDSSVSFYGGLQKFRSVCQSGDHAFLLPNSQIWGFESRLGFMFIFLLSLSLCPSLTPPPLQRWLRYSNQTRCSTSTVSLEYSAGLG